VICAGLQDSAKSPINDFLEGKDAFRKTVIFNMILCTFNTLDPLPEE